MGYLNEFVRLPGHTVRERVSAPRPSEYVSEDELPTAFTWQNVNGTSYVTKSLNQHIPQYCGSCWAHGSLSALADRVKIARGAKGADVNLAVQYILNCGAEVAGSCHGGSHSGTYQFISDSGYVPFDTCLQYEACSAESSEGHCAGGDYSCTMENTCRTCSTFSSMGGFCSELDFFPNVTVADFGEVSGASDMQKEIFARGPIACVVNAEPLHKYTGGIYTEDTPGGSNHIISVVGWGDDAKAGPYWIVRNSWGEYWGEMGYFRIGMGSNLLQIEADCAWATPATWTEHNFGCYEDGSNCVTSASYTDPGYARVAQTQA
jgi:cathepsin X